MFCIVVRDFSGQAGARCIKLLLTHIFVAGIKTFPLLSPSLWVPCITSMEGCRIIGQNLNILIDIWKYFSGLYSAGRPLSEHFKASCLPHKRERTWYFSWTLHFYFALISLHPRLFSYLQGKKPPRSIIFASLFKQFVVILPSAGQHVQYNVCIHQPPLAY